jgi:hypothetical protein
MFEFTNFSPNVGRAKPVETYDSMPSGGMEIYQLTEADFLPEGKGFDDLTEKELKHLKNQYRFRDFRPSQYQAITWRTQRNGGL